MTETGDADTVVEYSRSGVTEHRGGPHSDGGMSRRTRTIIEWLGVVIGAVIVALVVKTFLVQAFYIPSESMYPTLHVGDRVLVNKLGYDSSDVSRGDIVVFSRPGGPGPEGIHDLIKRVVGLPGETIQGKQGAVWIDGERLEEPWLEDGVTTSDFPSYEIRADEIFVLGDNRNASDDSRRFLGVPLDSVVGRAFVIVWPLGDVGTL